MLHITNGDMAVGVPRAAEFPWTFAPWRDVLHDGPVPRRPQLAQFSRVRVEFIVSCGWGKSGRGRLAVPDTRWTLDASANEDEIRPVVRVGSLRPAPVVSGSGLVRATKHGKPRRLSLIGVDKGSRRRLPRLSQLKPDAIGSLFEARAPVSAAQLALAVRAWEAFRARTLWRWMQCARKVLRRCLPHSLCSACSRSCRR